MSSTVSAGRPRCAVHPARPAVDSCPVCGRPRCGADASDAPGGGCLACQGRDRSAADTVQHPPLVEGLVRAALAASAAGMLGAAVSSQYVGAAVFDLVTPALVGVACGAVAIAASRARGRTRLHGWVRAVAVVYAVLGTAYGFRLVVGGESPFSPAGRVLPPYAAAVAGAWLWTQPTRRRPGQGAGRSSRRK